MKLGIVVQYYSNDSWLWPLMREQCLLAADHVVAVRYDTRFDGKPEPFEYLGVPTLTMPHNWETEDRLLLNRSRFAGALCLPKTVTHVLFLDADEIPEGERLRKFRPLSRSNYLACHWYFRDPCYRARQKRENSGLLIAMDCLKWAKGVLHNRFERRGMIYDKDHSENVCRPNPMVHHFSWVGTRERILTKVKTFTHSNRDWVGKVEKEWSQPQFSGKDFVHGYEYDKVDPPFGLDVPCPSTPSSSP